jgi:hypothetical protein
MRTFNSERYELDILDAATERGMENALSLALRQPRISAKHRKLYL